MTNLIPEALRSPGALRVLASVAVLFILLGGFVKLGGEIAEGETRAFDEWALHALRSADVSDPIGPPWFEELVRDATALGGNMVLGLVVAMTCVYLALVRRWRIALFLFVAIALGLVAIFAIPPPVLVGRPSSGAES